jgi:multicomponent Na+:H+ antiporter subunit D
MNEAALPLLAVAVPAAGALLIGLAGRRPDLRETITLLTALVLFAVVAGLLPAVLAGERPQALIAPMLPGLDLALRAEPLGMLFALIASALWIINSIY